MIYKANHIYTPEGPINGYLIIEKGKIKAITKEKQKADVDFGNKLIIPGIFDTHNHASGGYHPYGKTDKIRVSNNKKYLKNLAAKGVTSVLTTLFSTVADEESIEVLTTLSNKIVGKQFDGATSVGINFEGPFLNRVGENGVRYVPDPVDLKAIKQYIDICGDKLKEMGMAPELPGAVEATEVLLQNGTEVAMTHTDAKSQEAFEAFDRGVSISTHTCNVMVGIHHRNIGGLGAALMDDRVTCELICDGMHVCNDMLKLIFRLKPHDKIMMISDSSAFEGLPKGKYVRHGETINVNQQGFVLDEHGSLSGSSKPVIYGMKNIVENCDIPLEEAIKMASYNPCMKFGLTNKGSLAEGKDADFVVIDRNFKVYYTYNGGRKVYDYQVDTDLINQELLSCRVSK
ncbi:MAG: N-acetylglucosamine-6-phosphate deacetylase [Erysipelotrichaceae bacterium]|nr:N-acetylglucosamine-6-phosphate deacetylase [Erysipelotrichaceae bacterium]